MRTTLKIALSSLALALPLSACGSSEESLDTSYEEELPPPVAQPADEDAPAPDNDSIEDGIDELIDEEYSGEAVEEAREDAGLPAPDAAE